MPLRSIENWVLVITRGQKSITVNMMVERDWPAGKCTVITKSHIACRVGLKRLPNTLVQALVINGRGRGSESGWEGRGWHDHGCISTVQIQPAKNGQSLNKKCHWHLFQCHQIFTRLFLGWVGGCGWCVSVEVDGPLVTLGCLPVNLVRSQSL